MDERTVFFLGAALLAFFWLRGRGASATNGEPLVGPASLDGGSGGGFVDSGSAIPRGFASTPAAGLSFDGQTSETDSSDIFSAVLDNLQKTRIATAQAQASRPVVVPVTAPAPAPAPAPSGLSAPFAGGPQLITGTFRAGPIETALETFERDDLFGGGE